MVATPLYFFKLFLSSRRDLGCDRLVSKWHGIGMK